MEIVKVEYDNEQPMVFGRELHRALEIKDWFPRMCEYGFEEGKDFCSILSESTGGRPSTDHRLTIEMAKEICMIQRTEIGKRCREYFLEIERKWNSPESVFARALQMANQRIEMLTQQTACLTENVAVKDQQIAELTPKASYYDVVLACKDLMPISQISKDYGWSAKRMNEWQGVQYKQGNVWLLYQKYAKLGYTSTKTNVFPGRDGSPHTKVHTYWTQKGRLFIYDLMKADGNYPMIER